MAHFKEREFKAEGGPRFSRRAPSATGHQQPEVQPEYNCHGDRCGEKVAVDEIHQLHLRLTMVDIESRSKHQSLPLVISLPGSGIYI
ncbi:hypothetical protein [Bradyrhizobium sp. BR 1433]|uniref:hypothetical protein n=1 Tax=Bradyrhizobium sp. BR 1433 TaxID=3447967 RepID=UPI003EE6048C